MPSPFQSSMEQPPLALFDKALQGFRDLLRALELLRDHGLTCPAELLIAPLKAQATSIAKILEEAPGAESTIASLLALSNEDSKGTLEESLLNFLLAGIKTEQMATKLRQRLAAGPWSTPTLRRALVIRKSALGLLAGSLLLWFGVPAFENLRNRLATASKRHAMRNDPSYTRLHDLSQLRNALVAYHATHGKFPVSDGWYSTENCWGKSKSDWIPGLVPFFLPQLPTEPTPSLGCERQYMFISDGNDYKLISRMPPDFSTIVSVFPEMSDPSRTGIAYGYWSANAAGW